MSPAQSKDRDHVFLILKVKEIVPTIHMLRKLPWRSKRECCHPAHKPLLESTLAKRHMCMQGRTVSNQIGTQSQAKQDDWSKGIRKKCPICVIQPTMRAWLFLWVHPCVYPQALFSLLINTLLASLLSMWKSISIELTSQGFVTGLCPGGLGARFSTLIVKAWLQSLAGELKFCLKLLPGQGHWDQHDNLDCTGLWEKLV